MVRRIALVFLGSVFALPAAVGWAGTVSADNASVATTGLTFSAAVNAEELADQRGAGLKTATFGKVGEDDLAVILWDEFKPHPAAGSVVLGGGVDSAIASSITGTMK